MNYRKVFLVALLLVPLCVTNFTRGGEQPTNADRLTELFFSVTDTVLNRHLDPPVRQQMLLSAMKAIYADNGREFPTGLSRRISELAGRDDIQKFLATELLSSPAIAKRSGAMFEQMFVRGLLTDVGEFVPANESRVAQQLRENQYVGIGIRLSFNENMPTIFEPFPRGPAHLAGAKNGDRILSVDDVPTEGKKLAEVVKLLRGPKGTKVSIVVRQPGEEKTRTLEMVRDVVPIDTVEGVTRDADSGEWDFRIDEKSPIAYLRIRDIKGSTVHELRKIASRLHSEKYEALILDLTACSGSDLRHAGMLADVLLGKCTIGKVQERNNLREILSDEDELFAGWPMVVLIGPGTIDVAEWVAASLGDNKRATLVGTSTMGFGFLDSFIALPNDIGEMVIPTGVLLKAGGESLLDKNRVSMPARIPHVLPLEKDPGEKSIRPGVQPSHEMSLAGDFKSHAMKKALELLQAELAKADEETRSN